MNRVITASLIIITIFTALSCGGGIKHTPPPDSEILSFTQNMNIKEQHIYQHDSIYTFVRGEYLHRFWAGVNKKASHRLHVRLLSNSKDILFTVYFPNLKKKFYSNTITDKNLTGYAIQEQLLLEDEFIIEVFAPVAVSFNKNPDYRLFVGIQGNTPLKFYTK